MVCSVYKSFWYWDLSGKGITRDYFMIVDNEDITILEYSFSKKELFLLAKYLRTKQEELPEGLEIFYKTLEDSIYNCLSLEEVKRFYSWKNFLLFFQFY